MEYAVFTQIPIQILLFTSNLGKLREFKTLFGDPGIVLSTLDTEAEEIQHADPETVGRRKLEYLIAKSGADFSRFHAVFCDDTSLSVSALNGMPGPFIRWFLKGLATDGLFHAVSQKGNDRCATALCTLSIYFPVTGKIQSLTGKTTGQIVSPVGADGFGWDSIFRPDGYLQTYAEMNESLKNKISHRAKAVEEFKKILPAETADGQG